VVVVEGKQIAGPSILPSDFPSRREAQSQAFALLQDRLDQITRKPALPLAAFAKAWLETKDGISPTTRQTYRYWVRALDSDPLGALSASAVTTFDIEAWKARFCGKAVTLRKRLVWLHQLLKEAGNPAQAAMPRKERSRRRPLSDGERARLAELFRSADPELQLMILLTRDAMLRRSDAAGLRHEDREGDGIWINRVVVKVAGKLVVKDRAKSDRGNAWVPLSPALMERIGEGREGYVLGNGKRPIDPQRISRRIAHLCRELGVPSMGPHALRRTGGMELLESGVDVVTAAEIMRHDPQMLLAEYARSRRDLKIAAIQKVHGKVHRRQKGA